MIVDVVIDCCAVVDDIVSVVVVCTGVVVEVCTDVVVEVYCSLFSHSSSLSLLSFSSVFAKLACLYACPCTM